MRTSLLGFSNIIIYEIWLHKFLNNLEANNMANWKILNCVILYANKLWLNVICILYFIYTITHTKYII